MLITIQHQFPGLAQVIGKRLFGVNLTADRQQMRGISNQTSAVLVKAARHRYAGNQVGLAGQAMQQRCVSGDQRHEERAGPLSAELS